MEQIKLTKTSYNDYDKGTADGTLLSFLSFFLIGEGQRQHSFVPLWLRGQIGIGIDVEETDSCFMFIKKGNTVTLAFNPDFDPEETGPRYTFSSEEFIKILDIWNEINSMRPLPEEIFLCQENDKIFFRIQKDLIPKMAVINQIPLKSWGSEYIKKLFYNAPLGTLSFFLTTEAQRSYSFFVQWLRDSIKQSTDRIERSTFFLEKTAMLVTLGLTSDFDQENAISCFTTSTDEFIKILNAWQEIISAKSSPKEVTLCQEGNETFFMINEFLNATPQLESQFASEKIKTAPEN